ncbi:hypothetical protein D9M68_632370 [compost metagenome]
MRMSLPAMPLRVSLPSPPLALSSPALPTKLSSPTPPLNNMPTMPVAADSTVLAKPWLSVKLATTRSNWPTCPAPGTKVAAVAPRMLVQVVPLLDACHWKLKVVPTRPSGSARVPRLALST